ncbi:glycogen debranching protein GlgX [Caenispirillum salinarum]|uniref:glycogen debranching protein GlgX n=1 Tax=Caenispirillum salinarum TaxID=859058 RepID=UPI00384D2DD9
MSHPHRRSLQPGAPYPLGATWDGHGVNFAVFSENAEAVELCLFDPSGRREQERIRLPERTDAVWHGYIPDLMPGQLYGYRVHGPYDPPRGMRFNPNKLLVDPYARALSGEVKWTPSCYAYRLGSSRGDLSFDRRDSARSIPKGVVVNDAFPWNERIRRPRMPWTETIVYELHPRGATMLHPDVPAPIRGTLAGLASEPLIGHLVDLGVTSVELLPIYAYADEPHLVELGKTNYWGYNPYNFFAPAPRLLSSGNLDEVKTMVSRFHEAGLEVILDVVYNHTCEGNELGPTISLRGFDNASYYHLVPENPRYYENHSGCGNTMNLTHPRVLQMVMDSLRHWAEVMRVDGFRFDLAPAMGRDIHGFDANHPFMAAVRQDPVLNGVKLIAEPWDIGPAGYRVGSFPPGWREWNDGFRNNIRSFWRSDPGQGPAVATRVAGSSDIYSRRGPTASINFITAHDGFTLADLVSYNAKHNEANGENNRDGTDNNISWNCGVEGATNDPDVLDLRYRQKRNLLATLLLSQGVPMILGGDELGNSQRGNNNAYCQDNEIGWIDWSLGRDEDMDFLAFARMLVHLRRANPAFRRKNFFKGALLGENGPVKDITWLSPAGQEMTPADWNAPMLRCFGFHLGDVGDGAAHAGHKDQVVVLMNAGIDPMAFRLPSEAYGGPWVRLFDTMRAGVEGPRKVVDAAEVYPLGPHAMAVFTQERRGARGRTGRRTTDRRA